MRLYKSRVPLSVFACVFAIAALTTGIARAHSFPETETPSAGKTLDAPPAAVSIKFDAPIEHLFASLEVDGPDGKNRAVGGPVISSGARTMTVKLGPLAPGVYTVKWAVVCIDTHHTNGSYIFTVKGSGG